MEFPFKSTISGYFEFPTDNARRLLPTGLEPVELHHGSSILSMTVLDMPESVVGPHRQVILSVVVAPLVQDADAPVPKVAVFPCLVGTTTEPARQAAGQFLHLPQWKDDVEIDLVSEGESVTARIMGSEGPIAELTVFEYEWARTSYVYQCFLKEPSASYLANVRVDAELSEHEEERGRLKLYDHPFNAGVVIGDVYDVPFREAWMREGTQDFAIASLPAA
jgi:hypothetical protein